MGPSYSYSYSYICIQCDDLEDGELECDEEIVDLTEAKEALAPLVLDSSHAPVSPLHLPPTREYIPGHNIVTIWHISSRKSVQSARRDAALQSSMCDYCDVCKEHLDLEAESLFSFWSLHRICMNTGEPRC